jgi:hypothetical protein
MVDFDDECFPLLNGREDHSIPVLARQLRKDRPSHDARLPEARHQERNSQHEVSLPVLLQSKVSYNELERKELLLL